MKRCRNKETIDSLRFCLISVILLGFIAITTGCNTGGNPYNDGYKKGKQEGERIGRQKGKQDGIKIGRKEGQRTGFTKGEKAGLQKGLKKGNDTGYRKGYNIGFEYGQKEGLKKGKKEGYKKGETAGFIEGYTKGTLFFMKKYWLPSLGLAILALLSIALAWALFYFLREPAKHLIIKTGELLGNVMVDNKKTLEFENKIKTMEEKDRAKAMKEIDDIYTENTKKNGEVNIDAAEMVKNETETRIHKAHTGELDAIVKEYKTKLEDAVKEVKLKS